MKIDRRNPRHWMYLLAFAVNVGLALLLRPFLRTEPRRVVLYGHKLNGNLLALYDEMERRRTDAFDAVFLALDPAYCQDLIRQGRKAVCATRLDAAILLARTPVVISDHGLHVMEALLWLTRIRFIDVWHGIPFKGFDAADFRVQRRYDEVWVASPLLRQLYITRYCFSPERVVTTGYARTDRLVNRREDGRDVRARHGLPLEGPLILFAPTWAQDSPSRSLIPFGLDAAAFLVALAGVAERHGGHVVVRAHLNAGDAIASSVERVIAMPQLVEPDTEGVLLACDVLICDWSSIAFDFLLQDRPTIFLDVPPPFRKGFSLGPEYRFGPVVSDLDALLTALDEALRAPEAYAPIRREMRDRIYAQFADGRSTERCVERLCAVALRGESSQ